MPFVSSISNGGAVSTNGSAQSLTYQIRITSLTYTVPSVVWDESDPFEIEVAPQKRITTWNPVNGTYLYVNQAPKPQISWSTEGYVGDTVTIELRRQGNPTFSVGFGVDLDPGSSPYSSWSVIAFDGRQTDYYLRVKSTRYSGSQITIVDSPLFEIDVVRKTITVTSPVETSLWEAGYSYWITWTNTGYIGDQVRIVLVYSQTGSETEVVSSTENTGSYYYDVEDTLDTGPYLVKVISEQCGGIEGSSNEFYLMNRASDYLVLTAPASGALWTIGSTVNVEWESNGTKVGNNLTVVLKKDGNVFLTVSPSVPIENEELTIDTTTLGISAGSLQFSIWISSLENPNFRYESPRFEIDFEKSMRLNDSLLSSQLYLVTGTTHNILWTGTGYLGRGDISVSRFDQQSGMEIMTVIAQNIELTTPTGQFAWTIPGSTVRAGDYLIEIKSTLYPFVNDTGTPFEIDTVTKQIVMESLIVQYPDESGFNMSATWSSQGYLESLSIWIVESSNESRQVLQLAQNVDESERSIEWVATWDQVQGVITPNHYYRLKIWSELYGGQVKVVSSRFWFVPPPTPSHSQSSTSGQTTEDNSTGDPGGEPPDLLLIIGLWVVAALLVGLLLVMIVIFCIGVCLSAVVKLLKNAGKFDVPESTEDPTLFQPEVDI